MLKFQNSKIRHNEQGFASIVIALILIIVLALLTIGFAQLARREQQSALDKQLASQAFYAAESGVNDAYKAIKSTNPVIQLASADPNQCYGKSPLLPGTTSNIIDANSGTQYTCVLVNLLPQSLVKDIDTDNSWNMAFNASQPPDSIKVTWSTRDSKSPCSASAPGSPCAGSNHQFSSRSSWNYPAVLQFSLTPLNHLDRNDLIANTYTVYMYPSTDSAASPSYSNQTQDQGNVVPGGCNSAGVCTATISGGFPSGVTSYLIHVVDYYDDSHLDVSATAGATQLSFNGAQAVIDSTGQDKNVLKRIVVHVPIQPLPSLPSDSPLETQNLCKRFTTYPTSSSQSQNTVSLPQVPSGFNTSSCNLN